MAEPGRLGPLPHLSQMLLTIQHAKTLQNSEICNEIDTTTPQSQLEIHTSAFGTLTAAKEEGTNQTSYG